MNEANTSETVLFLPNKKITTIILVVFFMLAGIGLRLIDFTDLPFDIATTRQFHSLIMARGYYYQMDTPDTLSIPQDVRQFALNSAKAEPVVEPPILEHMVAFTYRMLGHEYIQVGRIYSILFWVLGGIPIFLLSRRMMSINGAFATLAFYELVPFGVYASRSFQPDSMMIMLLLWALFFQLRWAQEDTLKNAVLAGLFSGLAILVKSPMVFFTGIPLAALVLQKGFKSWTKNGRVYLIAVLAVAPAVIYNVLSATIGGNADDIIGARFFPQLYTQMTWYLEWIKTIRAVVGYMPLVIGLLAFFLLSSSLIKTFYGSLLFGYLLYGFTFAYHIYSHTYYQMPLLVILAIGFGIGISFVFQKLEENNPHWLSRVLVTLIFVFSMALCLVRVRSSLVAADYRSEAKYWSDVGQAVGRDVSVVALTQDYGYPLNYWGFVGTTLWPSISDRDIKNLEGATDPSFPQLFSELTKGKEAFLVTEIDDFNNQTDLKQQLMNNFTYKAGNGYFVFDLAHPLTAAN